MTSRLLIVEDNPIEAREISFFTKQAGFEVEIAADAESGFERLRSESFDLLLCDLHLPGESGFALCRRVKSHDPSRRMPVVLLTRFSDPLNVLRGLEAGADGFISKGQSPAVIIDRLNRVLLRRQVPAKSDESGPDRIVFLQTEFEVTAERSQLLEVLLSGFEDVVHLNEKYEKEVHARAVAQTSLRDANAELKRTEAELRLLNASLEQRVAQRTQELKENVEKLEKKNAELDQFVYVASHDLQEPVRKLISFSTLLETDVEGSLNDKARMDLHYITDAARRMQGLVQDLLALSRAGRSAMKHEPVALDDCANQALDVLTVRIEETGAEIHRDPLPEVLGDRTMLTQLYQNLIGNALKFVCDTKPVVHLTAERNEGAWVFGVNDNGIGIEPEYADQIFAPFQRLHARNEYEGTGIGLSICQTTVERHGGRLWVESTPGVGSHFKFTLDAAAITAASCEPSAMALSLAE